MARDLPHLQLAKWHEPLPRRIRPGRSVARSDVHAHGAKLVSESEAVAEHLERTKGQQPEGVNPKLVFKLALHPKGALSDEHLGQLGLRVLSHEPNKVLVVFPDKGTLDQLQQHLREYAGMVEGGHAYAYLSAIESICPITPEDRIGPRPRVDPLADGEVEFLDVELWYQGVEECHRCVDELRSLFERHRQRVTDSWVGKSLCLLRVTADRPALDALIHIDHVAQVDRRHQPTFEMGDIFQFDLDGMDVEASAQEGLPAIVVVDSGVMQSHPLLAPCVGDAQSFPPSLGGPDDGDERTGGHGTAVAGLAAYGDIADCISSRTFAPSAQILSARVTDAENHFDPQRLAEHQLSDAVEYFVVNYKQTKVINISLGDSDQIAEDGQQQFRLAAVVDELAYEYRDHEVVFVVCSGNHLPDDIDDEEVLQQYPGYLLSPENRVSDPATSAIAITVGGVSCGQGRYADGRTEGRTDRLVAGQKGWPSPFARTGWGLGGAIKPEVVDVAGDLRVERGRIPYQQAAYAGVPTACKSFAPPDGQLLRTVAGTSFSAPRVSNLAARLFGKLPGASSNLVRALIAESAHVPKSRPGNLSRHKPDDEQILRIYGYGIPIPERALDSDLNDVLLLADDQIPIDQFALFLVPPLPEQFLASGGGREISVTLAFDPPTRRTRSDSYLGVTMSFGLYRNTEPENVAEALRSLSKEERDDLGESGFPNLKKLGRDTGSPVLVDLKPGTQLRAKGTLQRGLVHISRGNWAYDGGHLVLAVACQRRWAPEQITTQRFGLVVSLYHDDPQLDLHSHMRQHAQIYQRERIRV